MKKLRIVLSVLAFTLAIGVAYSSRLLTPPGIVSGYEYVPAGNPQCVEHQEACRDTPGPECTLGIGGPMLKDSPTGTCGNNLSRI